jgi:hypothetical protein
MTNHAHLPGLSHLDSFILTFRFHHIIGTLQKPNRIHFGTIFAVNLLTIKT